MFRQIIPARDCDHKDQITEAVNIGIVMGKQIHGRIVFVSPTVKHVGLESAYGKEYKHLLKMLGKRVGLPVVLESPKTYAFPKNNDVVIGVFLGPEHLDYIDGLVGNESIILTEWIEHELDVWRNRWGVDINNLDIYPINPLPDVARVAFDLLASNFNKTCPHPLDIERAKTTIRTLHKYANNLDPESVKSYLISNCHFNPKDASKISKYLTTLQNGGSFQGGIKTGLKAIYNNWLKQLQA